MINLQQLGNRALERIKKQSWFPYKTGNLKFHATKGSMISPNCYKIVFDSTIAPYIDYLEYGTGPHNIPRAFGRPLPFGTSGRFNGKFHPGSTKHKDFINKKCVNEIVKYLAKRLNGKVVEQ